MPVVLDGDQVVDGGVDEKNRPPEPPADPVTAPKGWRWDREQKKFVPRVRAVKPPEEAEPPADLPSLGSAPDSAWATGPDGRSVRPGDEPHPLSLEELADIEAVLELAVLPLLMGAERRDPYCGGAFVENWDNIRQKSIPIICKSPKLVEWLTTAGGLKDWLAFAAAVQPVASAVVRHHVTKTVRLVGEGEEQGGPVREEDLGEYAA